MSMQVLTNEKDFRDTLEKDSSFFLLKNSLTCPISSAAHQEYEKFSEESSVPCYVLHVQEARDLSQAIAEEFSVRHESPQALLFQNGEVTWNDSHGSITKQKLVQVVR